MVMGTPRYMSPEQARGLKLDARTDVFSLGVVLYEMVTGEPAFAGPSTAEIFVALLEKEPPPLRQFIDEVPDGVQALINQMLAKEPAQRHGSMRDVLDALAQLNAPTTSGSIARPALPPTLLAKTVLLAITTVLLLLPTSRRHYLGRRAPPP